MKPKNMTLKNETKKKHDNANDNHSVVSKINMLLHCYTIIQGTLIKREISVNSYQENNFFLSCDISLEGNECYTLMQKFKASG